ncbi:DDE-type integrase/transposase/recombinase [Micromonospora kangleipakensis]|uniref:DDE-type integrase/transposase/recombinase n=1 Tax=Micromonospora kangleipakensis TaxID=1077942 RepID=UPI00102A2864
MLKVTPSEVVTDAAPVYPAVLDDLIPSAWHHVERHANNPIEADHSQLKHRLRPCPCRKPHPPWWELVCGVRDVAMAAGTSRGNPGP